MENNNTLTPEEYGQKVTDHIKQIEVNTELEQKAIRQATFNIYFNSLLLEFLNKELQKLSDEEIIKEVLDK